MLGLEGNTTGAYNHKGRKSRRLDLQEATCFVGLVVEAALKRLTRFSAASMHEYIAQYRILDDVENSKAAQIAKKFDPCFGNQPRSRKPLWDSTSRVP